VMALPTCRCLFADGWAKIATVCCLVMVLTGAAQPHSDHITTTAPLPISPGWSIVGRSPPHISLEILVGVRQTRLHDLERRLLAVSDPANPQYGEHLSNEQVHALVAPNRQDLDTVLLWLQEYGGHSISPSGDWVRAKLSVRQLELLLNTTFQAIVHKEANITVHRAREYTLPREVHHAIDLLEPSFRLPPIRRAMKRSPRQVQDDQGLNTPRRLRSLYNITTQGTVSRNRMAVTAFREQYYHPLDLDEFQLLYCSGIECGRGSPAVIGDGNQGLHKAGGEVMLDIETITGVAGNITAEVWAFSGRSEDNHDNEPYTKWLSTLSNTSDAEIPLVFSTSYGDDEQSWSLRAAERLNVEYQKAGLRGITLLFSSGDAGANCEGVDLFIPETPSSSPWITAVGGTTTEVEGAPETAIEFSSGGFSNRWEMPAWQKEAVEAYLKNNTNILPPAKRGYNSSCRAYPDVSAQATHFNEITNFLPQSGVAGTSAAAPTVAAVVALLNDARLGKNRSPLGFINPLIYLHADLWNDITQGRSMGCDEDGWPASKGWDAVTGCGTPDFGKLVKQVLLLP